MNHKKISTLELHLFEAVQKDNLDTVLYLVKLGADIQAADICRRTPLDLAIQLGHSKIAHMLCQHILSIKEHRDIIAILTSDINCRALIIINKSDELTNMFFKQGPELIDTVLDKMILYTNFLKKLHYELKEKLNTLNTACLHIKELRMDWKAAWYMKKGSEKVHRYGSLISTQVTNIPTYTQARWLTENLKITEKRLQFSNVSKSRKSDLKPKSF